MAGAIAIAGMACLRSGAGLVSLAVPESSLHVVAGFDPCYMTIPLPCDAQGRLTKAAMQPLDRVLNRSTCLAIGPGLGQSAESDKIVETLFSQYGKTLIVDADGLNALSESDAWLRIRSDRETRTATLSPRILTPHPGEWERLCGVPAKDRSRQIEQANEISLRCDTVILLKGHKTWITDGRRAFENTTGNASMAAGGNGDCLTGMIAALVAQQMTCFDAACLGAHLHGLAGDIAHRELGSPSTLATDLIRFLPAAFRAYQFALGTLPGSTPSSLG